MAVIENDVIKVTVSSSSTKNVIKVSPGVAALSSVSLSLNELNDVDTTGITNGQTIVYENGSFVAGDAGAVKTINGEEPDADGNVDVSINDLTDVKIIGAPAEGDALIFSNGFWTKGDAGASVLDDLTDVNVPTPAPGAILKYNGNQWTAAALSIPSVPATYYHQRYATDAQTFLTGATETVELYYTARADGDGLHESAQSDTPTAGYDIQRKLYYSEKAKADPDTSADWTQFTAIADNTSYNDAKTALLAYLNERTGGTSPISLKITWEEVVQAPSFTGLLNETYGSGAAAAYSVRRLNGNYTGAAIEVERSSDNGTQDIGFDSNGDLDESALTTFCTGTTCKVRTWYDQSQTGGTGSGNDAVQTDHTLQPTIYTGGAIVKENGRVAIDFNDDKLHATFNYTVTAQSTYGVGVFVDGASDRFISQVESGQTIDYLGDEYLQGYRSAANTISSLRDNGARSSIIVPNNTRILFVSEHTGSALKNYVSGYGGSSYTNTLNNTFTKLLIKSSTGPTTEGMGGTMQEVLMYTSDKSTDRTSIESNIGDYFTQNTPLLDTYSGAAAAYSLRLLDSSYVGSAVEVYNGSSYADIGFNVFGELDTVALAAHCGSNNGFVSKWYDQSGNGVNASESATNEMPKIYDGTTGVITKNGKPAVEFDGANDKLTTGALTTSTDFYGTVVMAPTATATRYALGNTSNFNTLFLARTEVSGSNFTPVMGSGFNVDSSGQSFAIGTQVLITSQKSGTQAECFANGQSNGATTVNNPALSGFYFTTYGGTYWKGTMQEVVFYGDDQSSNRTNIEDNINTFYNIY